MRIISMTATFGKLNHKTLTLNPGLNIIEAPNEWGKSTWCAFLTAMLYGIDSSQRTTQTQLADKEHYAPWSGQPMSGRLELLWNGKEITIERSTKGRIPMGEFSAYETHSGLPVTELTADNCGQVLLGVERSVFLRAGFIRQTEMPVTQDEALRRRLNALVTTGDECSAGDLLAKKLKELKNSCRHNKTGALPQAEARQAQLIDSLTRLSSLQEQLRQIKNRQAALQQRQAQLKNHQLALAYERSTEGLYRLNLAQESQKASDERTQKLQEQVAQLPERLTLTKQLSQLQRAMEEVSALESKSIPADVPYEHELFGNLTPEEALARTRSHKAAWDQAASPGWVLPVLAAMCAATGVGFSFLWSYAWFPGLVAAALLLGIFFHKWRRNDRVRKVLSAFYGALPPDAWVPLAEGYLRQDAAAKAVHEAHWQRLVLLKNQLSTIAGDLSPEDTVRKWQGWLELYAELEQAQQNARQAALRVADLEASVKQVSPAPQPDDLDLSEEATSRELASLVPQLQQLQLQAGQCLGQIEALGCEDTLRQQLDAVGHRIEKLQAFYDATVLALSHLEQATLQLQQRFAPQLTANARELFSALTDGRYDRLQLDQHLQLQAGAENEDGLHTARWRSDGTMDQLYLALRLAVAQQLTPSAPLVLDDALVRFDDTRHTAAMKLLASLADDKQVLVFTCQGREGSYSPESRIEI